MDKTMISELTSTLKKHRNEGKAVKMKAYMRDKFEFFGIPKKERSHLSKPFIMNIYQISISIVVLAITASCRMQKNNFIQDDPISILALGDSYTIGESVDKRERWPEQFKAALEGEGYAIDELKIIAKTGWRTDELRQAVSDAQLEKSYDIVILLIGVNNQYQKKEATTYEKEFKQCLEQALEYVKSKENLIVISIPDYAYTPFGQTKNPGKISEEIDYYNEVNRRISRNNGVQYVYITDLTRKGLEEPKLVASDGLHPSAELYKLFIIRILDAVGGAVRYAYTPMICSRVAQFYIIGSGY